MRAFCDTGAVEMNRDIYLIPLGLKFGFTFGADIGFGNHSEIQNNEQNQYRHGNKVPRDIEVAAKPIDLAG
jgi:hypothetical protein